VSFNWTVGSPITITDPGSQTFNAGDTVSLPIQATDSANGTLQYSASGLPSGLPINSSGVIAGTISSTLAAGLYTSTISVTAGTNTAQDSISWTILPSATVVLTNPGTQSSSEGGAVSLCLSASDLMPAYDDIPRLLRDDGCWHLHYASPGTAAAADLRGIQAKPLSKETLQEVPEALRQKAA
jgi:hypothetical protein